MAYFDNPERAAKWERELALLRAERKRRQSLWGRAVREPLGPELVSRGAAGFGFISDKARPGPAPPPPRPAPAPAPGHLRTPMRFEQLKQDAAAQKAAPAAQTVTETPEDKPRPVFRGTDAAFSPKPEPITFAQLLREAPPRSDPAPA